MLGGVDFLSCFYTSYHFITFICNTGVISPSYLYFNFIIAGDINNVLNNVLHNILHIHNILYIHNVLSNVLYNVLHMIQGVASPLLPGSLHSLSS